MKRTAITLAYCTHHDTPVVSLRFEKDHSIISKVKTLKGATWSQSQGLWYIPRSDFKLSEVFDQLSLGTWLDYSVLNKKWFLL